MKVEVTQIMMPPAARPHRSNKLFTDPAKSVGGASVTACQVAASVRVCVDLLHMWCLMESAVDSGWLQSEQRILLITVQPEELHHHF